MLFYSVHFVSFLNAGAVGDEDNYGLEMEAYLNEEDVIKPEGSKRAGILKFCTPNATVRTSKPADRKQGEGKKPRKISVLPSFSSDEDFDKGSDDDLPEVDIDGTHAKRKNLRLVDGAMDTEEDSLSSNRRDTTEVESATTESATTTSDNNSREMLLEGLNKWKKKRKKRINSGEQDAKGTRNRKMTKDAQNEMLNKEKENISFEEPVIEIIPNNDLDEFDDPIAVERHEHNEIQAPTMKFDRGINNAFDGSCSFSKDVEFNDSRNEFEEVMPNYEMFPIYTNESALIHYVSPKKIHARGSRTRVQTPPSDYDETMAYMAITDRLSPVNVLDLVDKWEKEKDSETSNPSPPPLHMFTRNEVRSTSSRVSISNTSIRINTTSNKCNIIERNRPARDEVNSTMHSNTDIWTMDGTKVPDAPPAMDVSFNREMNEVIDLQNFMADKSPARSATSATLNTTTESDGVQSLGSMRDKVQSGADEKTVNHSISIAGDDSDTGLKAKCEESQLHESINKRSGKSGHNKNIETISICSKESDKDVVNDTHRVNHGTAESAVGCSTDMMHREARTEAQQIVIDDIGRKSEEISKDRETKEKMDDFIRRAKMIKNDHIRTESEEMCKERETKEKMDDFIRRARMIKNDLQRCQSISSDSDEVEVLETKQYKSKDIVNAYSESLRSSVGRTSPSESIVSNQRHDDAKSVVSVCTESSAASADRQNPKSNEKTLNGPSDNALDDKSLEGSKNAVSDDILAPQDISSVRSIADDELETPPQLGCISTPVPWSKTKAQPSVKTPYNFLFDNDTDDSVFANFRTPFSSRTTQNHTPTQTSPRPGDTSQITFTQALAVVHDSLHSEGSQGFEQGNSPRPNESSRESISDESVSPVFITKNASFDKALSHSETKKGQSNSGKEDSFDDVASRSAASISESSKISTDRSHADAPHFDLGFDFSDPEDDNVHIIPPSPNTRTGTQPFSQRLVKSSSNASLSAMKSFVQEAGKTVEMEDSTVSDAEMSEESQSLLLGTVEKHNENSKVVRGEQRLARELSKRAFNEQDDLQKKNVPDLQKSDIESPSALQSREQNYFISNQISSQIKQNSDPPVAVVAPTRSVPTDQNSQEMTDIKSNKVNSDSERRDYTCDFSDLDEDELLDEILEPERRETKQTEQSGATKDSFVGEPVSNQVEIETIDPNDFDTNEDDFEPTNQKCTEAKKECTEAKKDVADGENDSSDSGKGSPVLTLSLKRSEYSSCRFNFVIRVDVFGNSCQLCSILLMLKSEYITMMVL